MPSPSDSPIPRRPAVNPPRPAPARDYAAEEQINRLLTVASIQFRRGQTVEAEKAVQELLQSHPGNAPALELQADILEARGDHEGAQASLKAAIEAEPGRTTAEAKLARAALKRGEQTRMQQMGVAYAASDASLMRLGDGSRRSSQWAALASALIPGLGQYVNGETTKGVILAVLYFAIFLVLSLLPDSHGLARQISLLFIPSVKAGHVRSEPVSGFAWFLLVLLIADWLYAMIDAASAAKRAAATHEKDGWQV